MSTDEMSQLQRLIFNNIPTAVVAMDRNFTITFFNRRAEELTGFTAKEATGKRCYDILNSSCCRTICPVRTLQNVNMKITGVDAELIDRHGKPVPVLIGAAALVNDAKKVIGYIETIEDNSQKISELRERNNFISMIAHDMKSPILGILGLTKRLQKDESCHINMKLHRYLKMIYQAGERLEETVREFLEFSHLESRRMRLKLDLIDINEVLQEAVEMHQMKAEEEHISLLCDCQPLTLIAADEKRLFRVFSNIIDNAIKYSAENAVVSIRSHETAGEIVITFQDQGYGIRPEEIPHLFDAFYRAESKDTVNGYGLGLTAASTIICQHGGKITVESTPKKGSAFTIQLPKKKVKSLMNDIQLKMLKSQR
jgi:two-component system phosphate regulon sensor histidine kinase PhoR